MNILSGYSDGTFHPMAHITRGQLAKIVSNAAGFSGAPTNQTFSDVAPNSAFWMYIETMASRGIIAGYQCGGLDEPCDAEQRPYFRPQAGATRGQIAKIVSMAAQINTVVTEQVFEDVTSSSAFFEHVGHIYDRGVIGGYNCGGVGEPCIAPLNRPYFRPASNATRAQVAKIANFTFYPNCQAP